MELKELTDWDFFIYPEFVEKVYRLENSFGHPAMREVDLINDEVVKLRYLPAPEFQGQLSVVNDMIKSFDDTLVCSILAN